MVSPKQTRVRQISLPDTHAAKTSKGHHHSGVAGGMKVFSGNFSANEGFGFSVCGFGFLMYALDELSIP